ncbi:MAG: phenylalanine--tRNA ligase subunit beta [Pseudomonadales bacterium]
MQYNEAWLQQWVNPDVDPDRLLEALTMAGLEVESVTPVAPDFSGVVVATVAGISPHPNADKLSVCEVNDGTGSYQVVCGAPNVRAGMTVAFAKIGAVLPEGFRIRKAKLRDVESHGMLCSAAELGLGDDHDGILDLPGHFEAGADLRVVLELDDRMIELNLTPNRGDCLSICGLAREVGVLFNVPVHPPAIGAIQPTHEEMRSVSCADAQGCPRYLGRIIRGIDLRRPSPLWLVERLRRAGLRSIDPVVDVTNYVMLELGQPMHAFDLNQLRGDINVRRARPGERLTLLDGREVTLDGETLLITDAAGPVAIAGVMGGDRSGVQEDTADVFLECAFFHPLAVSGTARRYGLHTDASHRYERGVDHDLQHQAMERATGLLLETVGGAAGPVTEAVYPEQLPPSVDVSLRESRLHELLGVQVAAGEVDAALSRLGFELKARSTDATGVTWTIRSPSHRFDIGREVDLVEEVCRIYGYNRIPSRRPRTALELRRVPRDRSEIARLKEQFAALGYQEAITYSFVDPRLQDLLAPGDEPLKLANPMSADQSVMRTTLLPGLIAALCANVARQADRVRLFEIGQCFLPGTGLEQPLRIGALIWGRREAENWTNPRDPVDFYDLKGDVEHLLSWAGLRGVSYEPLQDPVLHPGQAAVVRIEGESVGRIGRLHPEVEKTLDTGGEIFVLEFEADALLRRGARAHQGLSRFPSVRRDLALVVSRETPGAEILRVIEQSLGEILVDLRLFDLYQGKGIDSTEKSVGVGLTLQKPSATLTDAEIGALMDTTIEALTRQLGARLR